MRGAIAGTCCLPMTGADSSQPTADSSRLAAKASKPSNPATPSITARSGGYGGCELSAVSCRLAPEGSS